MIDDQKPVMVDDKVVMTILNSSVSLIISQSRDRIIHTIEEIGWSQCKNFDNEALWVSELIQLKLKESKSSGEHKRISSDCGLIFCFQVQYGWRASYWWVNWQNVGRCSWYHWTTQTWMELFQWIQLVSSIFNEEMKSQQWRVNPHLPRRA